ncbi:MAG: hypothetical protein AB1439_06045 [candidate division FCPU426 bacterium]
MKTRFHGLLSLGLATAALAVGWGAMAKADPRMAWMYLGVMAVSAPLVIFSYCAKCSNRGDCGHVIPGWLTRMLPERQPGPYRWLDYLGTVLPGLALVGLPQLWLWRQPGALALFWLLLLAATLDIRVKMCVACRNRNCLLARRVTE